MKKKASRGKGRPVKNEVEPIDAKPDGLVKAIFVAADSKLKKQRILVANRAPVKKKEDKP